MQVTHNMFGLCFLGNVHRFPEELYCIVLYCFFTIHGKNLPLFHMKKDANWIRKNHIKAS